MNFLELCKEVHNTCQIDGDTIVSVENQTGMNLRVVTWVNRAYQDIQRHRTDWKFRQELASISVLSGQWQLSNLRATLEHLDKRTITVVNGASQVHRVSFAHYDEFYNRYESQTRTTGRPTVLTVANNYDLYLNPIPTEDLTLKFWYTKTIDVLVNNTDEPIIRNAHHDSILWKAVKYYAEEEEAASVYQTASLNYTQALNRMELDLRPETYLQFTPLA